jgi:hypothetical protein
MENFWAERSFLRNIWSGWILKISSNSNSSPKFILNRHPYCWNHSNKIFALKVRGPRRGLVQYFYDGGTSTVYRSNCKKPGVSISPQFWDLMHPASQTALISSLFFKNDLKISLFFGNKKLDSFFDFHTKSRNALTSLNNWIWRLKFLLRVQIE